jgi:hypothetical protein
MNVDTASEVLKEHQKLNEWSQAIQSNVGVEVVDLSVCFDNNPTEPPNVKCSPSLLPENTIFKFDESKYKGEESEEALREDLKSACLGCSLHWQRGHVGRIQTKYDLRCDHCRLPDHR